jgi:hypothetical protein
MIKTLGWSALFGVSAFVISFSILKMKGSIGSIRIGTYGPFETVSFLVNLIVALVSIVSLYIAIAAYLDTQESGKEQKLVLEASRNALESSVALAQAQQKILDENLKISSEHFAIVKEHWQAEKERLSRKPEVKIGLGGFSAEELLKGDPIKVTANDSGYTEFDFVVTNFGKATINKPTIVISTRETLIKIDKRRVRIDRENLNILQFSTSELNDFVPASESGGGHAIMVDIQIPKEVKGFDLSFKIFGENLPSKIIELKILVLNH